MRLANISLEEYLLLRFLRGENCSQNDITETERHLLFEWANLWQIQSPMTNLMIHRSFYNSLIAKYSHEPLLFAALVAAKDNLKLNFFGSD